jgi:hypothetical protein
MYENIGTYLTTILLTAVFSIALTGLFWMLLDFVTGVLGTVHLIPSASVALPEFWGQFT